MAESMFSDDFHKRITKERPIIFNTEMVKAILDGRKTQTRRVIKPNEVWGIEWFAGDIQCQDLQSSYVELKYMESIGDDGKKVPAQWCVYSNECPEEGCIPLGQLYGAPGDRLWVRETYRPIYFQGGTTGDIIEYSYKASPQRFSDYDAKWKPSIHMPHSASRITLEIKNIRTERLQDISEEDAIAEGVTPNCSLIAGAQACVGCGDECENKNEYIHYGRSGEDFPAQSAKESFQSLWGSISGEKSWKENPWVWVIEFKMLEPAWPVL